MPWYVRVTLALCAGLWHLAGPAAPLPTEHQGVYRGATRDLVLPLCHLLCSVKICVHEPAEERDGHACAEPSHKLCVHLGRSVGAGVALVARAILSNPRQDTLHPGPEASARVDAGCHEGVARQ